MVLANRRIQKAILDTGPLLDLLILEYVRNSKAEHQKAILERSRLSWYLAGSSIPRERLLVLLESIPILLTTTHVIAELHGFGKHTRDDHRWFWRYGMDLLKRKKLVEHISLRLLDMHESEELRNAVCEIGPTDVGLVELARLEGGTLLTNDERTLARIAWESGLDCRLIHAEIEER